MTKVAWGWRISASFMSVRRNVKSLPGEPKPDEAVGSRGRIAVVATSAPTRTPSGN
jgi:hypothetical protein